MFLKSVTLYGFKSFAQDTRIVLEPGISVIVGPNGGGKSNVIDAIRWALGEQRVKELRAERWEDLLHTDTKNRQAKMAEVSLLFDNHDGEMANWPESLQVTRRYYLSGDSEYLLNGRTARLKDIVDLFLDSGIGRFNYAIIGQGRVEAALLMKPKERLEQLEEAAGVSRYKVKRRETLQHLTDVQHNLGRLSDLVADVRHQREQIAEEAQTEKEYLDLQRQHHDLQLRYQLTLYRLAMEEQIQWQETLQKIRLERADLETELQALQRERDQEVLVQEQMTARLDSAKGKRESNRLALAVIDTHIARLEAEREGLQRETKSLEEQGRQVSVQLTEIAEKFPEFTGAEDNENRPESVDKIDDSELKSLNEAIRNKMRALDQKNRERQQQEKLVRNLAEEKQRQEKIRARVEGALQLESGEDLLAHVADLEAEEQELLNQQVLMKAAYEEVRQKYNAVKQTTALVIKEMNAAQQDLWRNEAQLKAIRSVESMSDDMPSSVRAVLDVGKKGQVEGVLGTLGSLIIIPAQFRLAIDVALGGQRHYVVTDTEVHARHIVDWLKNKRAGRVTLLPLDQIRPAHIPERDRNLGNHPGAVGWALDQISFDPRLRSAVSYVLGRVLLIESLQVGHAIGRLHQFRYRMVSLDGQVILAGGAISGGSGRAHSKGNGDKIAEISERINQLKGFVDERQERQRLLEGELEALEKSERESRQDLARCQERLSQLQRILEGGVGKTRSIVEMISALESVESRMQQEMQALNTIAIAVQNSEKEVESLKEAYQLRHQEYLRSEQVHTHRLELLAYYKEETRRLTLQKQEIGERLEQLKQAEGKVLGQLALRRQERAHLTQQIEEEADEIRETQLRLSQIEAALKEKGVRIRAIDTEDRQMAGRINYLEQQLLKTATKWEGYEPPEGDPLAKQELPEARKRLDEWQHILDTLGPVRPGVYALYRQLEERLEYLEDEKHDVELSTNELRETLRQIDQEVDVRITETAQQVEKAFADACFSLLGGEGGFRWIQDEERGVDLWVRLPGKKPGIMTLLSGGEKALGGISWLFALLSVRPSPFVVLDEVEAALDEANAQKVANYIRRHHGHTQYVIVTHHKSTMSIADALWGVAGDGRGRSRLVSVRIEQIPVVEEG